MKPETAKASFRRGAELGDIVIRRLRLRRQASGASFEYSVEALDELRGITDGCILDEQRLVEE